MKKILAAGWMFVVGMLLSGCSLFAVADAAVTIVATTVSVTAKVVGAGVEAVLPDDDEDEDGGEK